jgi:uncharacterized membrane protein
MSIVLVILRLIHIVGGVFWAGGTFVMVGFLTPTVNAAGPEGPRFMQRLMGEKRLSAALAVAALLTSLSGILLYLHYSGNFNPQWLSTKAGMALTIGGVAGLLAYGHGAAVIGRANMRMMAIGKAMAAAGGPPTPEQAQELQMLQGKAQRGAVLTAILLSIALIGMSIAQVL